jgi:16S rRNA (guanine527-N7)-methyltransferase
MIRAPVHPEAGDRERALALTPVSHETQARLDKYIDRLLATQVHTNLISPGSIPNLWTRHVADSLQLLDHAPDARRWIDLGSGGGFPGLVLACALADRAGAEVQLVESIGKKARFLEESARDLSLPVRVHPVRIEDFVKKMRQPVDVVTARALAPLDRLLDLAAPLLARGTQALFMKGQDVASELTTAAKSWNIDATLIPSKTHPDARIVAIRAATRKAGR